MPRQSARNKATAAPVKLEQEIEKKADTKSKNGPVKTEETVEEKVTTKGKNRTAKSKATVTKTTVTKKRKAADDEDHECDSCDEKEEEKPKPAAKKQRTKKAKDEDNMPLAERTAVTSLKRGMYIGAHVSGAGGVQHSIQNALNIGANSFALFLKSQRKWENPPLADEARDQFLSKSKEHNYAAGLHVLPHGSYLVNLAQADETKADQAYTNFIDDLQRCEALGIKLYNFHPGSTGGDTKEAACARIAAQLNKSHKATTSVVTVLENMCGSGNVVGSRFEELRDIIAGVEDKSRVGVCIDTCHSFAAGYDLRTPEAFAGVMDEFNTVVGAQYLKALHLNDSKAPCGSHRDLHANIGTGFLGLRAFHNIMNYAPFQNLPMVLETPIDRKDDKGKSFEDKQVWADEIKLLESLIGADPGTDDFKAKEKELYSKGAEERKRVQDQVDKKAEKDSKKKTPAKKRGKKKAETDDEESE